MKTMFKRWSLKAATLALTIPAVVMMGWAPVFSQSAKQIKPAQAGRRALRPSPSLAVLMVAYESVATGQTTANPELANAMKQALSQNPGARETFARLLQLYKALPDDQRIALVGKELASATPKTKLSPASIKGALFRKSTAPIAKNIFTKAPADAEIKQRPDNRRPATESKTFEATHADQPPGSNIKSQDLLKRGEELKEQSIQQEEESRMTGSLAMPGGMATSFLSPGAQNSKIKLKFPRYRVAYKGLFCSDEGDDWGSHCEPYVIFMMNQGGKVWTTLSGPYEDTDSGDKIYKDVSLQSNSPLISPLMITAVAMENDSWDPKDVVNAIQTAADVACLYYGGSECPEQAQSILEDILNWFLGLFSNDDDVVGDAVVKTIDWKYAAAHTGYQTEKGFAYDYWALFDGDSYRFWLAFDVQKL